MRIPKVEKICALQPSQVGSGQAKILKVAILEQKVRRQEKSLSPSYYAI